jgi:hypothetical protein
MRGTFFSFRRAPPGTKFGNHPLLSLASVPPPFLNYIMVIYQHPSALWAAFKKSDSRCVPTTPLLPTRIRIKNNGDGTGTARLVEAPTIRRSSFSLFNSSIKQGSKRKLSLTISRRSSDKAVRRDDEGFESGHAQSNSRSRSRFGKFGGKFRPAPLK